MKPATHQLEEPPVFEYIGHLSLEVIGTITGNQYHFGHAGARVEVDPRDQRYVALVPNLRRVDAAH